MGLLDWLKGKKSNLQIDPDRIWLTKQAKLDGIRNEITAALRVSSCPAAVFVVGHFQDCFDDLREMIAGARFDDDRILLTLAEALKGSHLSKLEENRNVVIVVAERHPLRSHDELLVDFARELACKCRIAFHMSLDDALMQLYGGDWVGGTLKKLGMKEDEAITIRMVSRRLSGAQQKILGGVTGDIRADSAQQWLEQNWRAI